MARVPKLAFSISATTRAARSTEVHAKDYFFVSKKEFERMKAGNEFAEWALVHGDLYGTPKKWLDEQLARGISILLDIDVQGGVQIMDGYPQAVSIFVVPPSFAVLEERLRERRSDSEEAVLRRLRNAMDEMEYIRHYAYVVVNDIVDHAVSRMENIVRAESLKRERVLKGTTWREFVGAEGKGV
jgi:guanylate kinase